MRVISIFRTLSTPAFMKLTCYFVSATRVGRKIVREGYVHQGRQPVIVGQRINQPTLRQNFRFSKTHTSNTCSEEVTGKCSSESYWMTVCDELASPSERVPLSTTCDIHEDTRSMGVIRLHSLESYVRIITSELNVSAD